MASSEAVLFVGEPTVLEVACEDNAAVEAKAPTPVPVLPHKSTCPPGEGRHAKGIRMQQHESEIHRDGEQHASPADFGQAQLRLARDDGPKR